MRSCLIREHPCLPPRLCPPPTILPFILPSFSIFAARSLYTRSVAVLNVLSLLMPRSACPRGRSTAHIFACSLLFRAPILSYTRAAFIVQNPCEKRKRGGGGGGKRRKTVGRRSGRDAPSLYFFFASASFKTCSLTSFILWTGCTWHDYIRLINKLLHR